MDHLRIIESALLTMLLDDALSDDPKELNGAVRGLLSEIQVAIKILIKKECANENF